MAPCRNCKRVKDKCKQFDIREKFIDACANNELEKVIACCGSLGLEVNTVSEDGESGLRTAVNNNSEDVVAWLLAQPEIEVNIVTNGITALMAACCDLVHPDIVRRLAQAPGVDLNWQDNELGLTAAHSASETSNGCVEVLARVPGVDWNKKNGACETPLFWALRWGNPGSVRTILAIPGVDYRVRANDGRTLAHAAVCRFGASVEFVDLLLGVEEVEWNDKDVEGDTPLMKALKRSKFDIVKVLLQSPRVDVTIADIEGRTPEIWARLATFITFDDCNINYQGEQYT